MGRAPFAIYKLPHGDDDLRRSFRRRLLLDVSNTVTEQSTKKATFTVVDMFCGCGGISFGLSSTARFRTVLGIDASVSALATFAKNHSKNTTPPKTILANIANLKPKTVRSELRKLGILKRQLDCLVGGPPCEGFSQNHGKAMAGRGHAYLAHNGAGTKKWYRSRSAVFKGTPRIVARSNIQDKRNVLFRKILAVARLIEPKIILIENVREFLTYRNGVIKDEIQKVLTKAGYAVDVRILNAADYGVPQMRRRAFVVAIRNDIAKAFGKSLFPLPTHRQRRRGDGTSRLTGDRGLHVTTWEAIGDLPPPLLGKKQRGRANTPESTGFRRFVRGKVWKVPSRHVVRSITPGVRKRIMAMRRGTKIHHLPARLRTKKFYANAYARLEWSKPANTITKSFTNLGSGKFCHPDKHRGITVREAARLQSFPDSFEFIATSQHDIADMIGGAVPPLLARAFGLRFVEALEASAKSDTAIRA
jgi:DNA (cytosine-5)-methyltransferase 1